MKTLLFSVAVLLFNITITSCKKQSEYSILSSQIEKNIRNLKHDKSGLCKNINPDLITFDISLSTTKSAHIEKEATITGGLFQGKLKLNFIVHAFKKNNEWYFDEEHLNNISQFEDPTQYYPSPKSTYIIACHLLGLEN